MPKIYKVIITDSGKEDIKRKKRYIIEKFKYREYAENYSKMIKKAIQGLDTLPEGYDTIGFRYRGYDMYLKPVNNHLVFFTVDDDNDIVTVLRVLQDGMDWENIIRHWLKFNKD